MRPYAPLALGASNLINVVMFHNPKILKGRLKMDCDCIYWFEIYVNYSFVNHTGYLFMISHLLRK